MSKSNIPGVCPFCAAPVVPGAKFCSSCAGALPAETNVSEAAADEAAAVSPKSADVSAPDFEKKELNAQQSTPAKKENTGSEQAHNENAKPKKTPRETPFSQVKLIECATEGLTSTGIKSRIIMLVVSVIMLALAFCPFAYTEAKISDDLSIRVRYTPLDSVNLAISSFYTLDREDVLESDIYAELEDFDIYSYGSELSLGQKNQLGKMMKKSLLLIMMSEDTPVRFGMILAAVISAIYLVFALVLFILSFSAFIIELVNKKHRSNSERNINKSAVDILWLLLAFLPIMTYALLQMCRFGNNGDAQLYISGGRGISWGLIASLAVAVAATLFTVIRYSVLKRKKGEGEPRTKTGSHILCLVLSVLLIISVFLPLTSITFASMNDDFEYEQKTVYVSISDVEIMSSSDVEQHADSTTKGTYPRLLKAASDIVLGEDEKAVSEYDVLNLLVFSYGRKNVSVLYAFIVILTLISTVFAAMLVRSTLKRVLFTSDNDVAIQALKILNLITVCIDFILMYIVNKIAEGCIDGELIRFMNVEIGIAPVLMLLFAIANVCTVGADRGFVSDCDYDNADVSYAPYVVGYKKHK